jgi:nitronate monooxygenase
VQNDLTKEIRAAAASAGRAEYLSLWAGQGAQRCRTRPAARLVEALAAEADAALARLS